MGLQCEALSQSRSSFHENSPVHELGLRERMVWGEK